jgi:hypothetical protein
MPSSTSARRIGRANSSRAFACEPVDRLDHDAGVRSAVLACHRQGVGQRGVTVVVGQTGASHEGMNPQIQRDRRDVRFGAHFGLNSDITALPKGAQNPRVGQNQPSSKAAIRCRSMMLGSGGNGWPSNSASFAAMRGLETTS